MFVAGIILSIGAIWYYHSTLSHRDRLAEVPKVALIILFVFPIVDKLTSNLPFDILNETGWSIGSPVVVLALCALAVSILGLWWFDLRGKTSHEPWGGGSSSNFGGDD